MKISQCMIVRDEEHNIERALSWGRGVVDEQIVVDTGSTDRTVEIAEKMGAKIYHFEWINDFSAAKNYAIEQCTGDWIAFLDADEYFSDEDAKYLKQMLESVDKKYDVNVIETPWAHLDANGKIKNIGSQRRLFKNKPYIRYINAIHEVIHSFDNKNKLRCYEIRNTGGEGHSFTVFHTGYAFTGEEDRIKKGGRNMPFIEQAIQKEPENALNYLYMADALALLDEYKKAAEYAEKAIEVHKKYNAFLDLERAYSKALNYNYYYLFSNECSEPESDIVKRMEKIYNEGQTETFCLAELDFHMAVTYYALDEYEKTIDFSEKCVRKLSDADDLQGRAASSMDVIYFALADSYFKLGDMQKFVKYACLYIRVAKNISTLPFTPQKTVAKLIFVLMDSGETLKSVFDFFSKLYDFENPADFTFVLKAAQDVKPPLFAQYMIENIPEKLRELM